MPELKTGDTLETPDALLLVENLPAGKHVFELRVADEAGNLSQPARVSVQVNQLGPRITSFDPAFAFPGEKTVIWVTGVNTDFAKNEVLFQGVRAAISGGSTKTLHATVPPLARTGPVTVINGTGQGVSDQPFFIPERQRLAAPGAMDMAFVKHFPDPAALIALLSSNAGRMANRCALWGLPERLPSERNPKPMPPGSTAELAAPATRLAATSDREDDFAIAWEASQPAASLLRWNIEGGIKVSGIQFAGRALDMLGGSTGVVGLFQDEAGNQWLSLFQGEKESQRGKVPEPLLSLYPGPAGKSVCGLSAAGNVFFFDLQTLAPLDRWETPLASNPRLLSCAANGGAWTFSASPPRAILLQGKESRTLDLGFAPEAVAAHPSGHHAFFAGSNQPRMFAVHLPDPGEQGLLVARVLNLPFPASGPGSLVLSPSGDDLLVLQAKNRVASFFNARTFRLGLSLPLAEAPRQAICSREGSLFAISGPTTIDVIAGASARA